MAHPCFRRGPSQRLQLLQSPEEWSGLSEPLHQLGEALHLRSLWVGQQHLRLWPSRRQQRVRLSLQRPLGLLLGPRQCSLAYWRVRLLIQPREVDRSVSL